MIELFLTTEYKQRITLLCVRLEKEGMLLQDTVMYETENSSWEDTSLIGKIIVRALEREIHVVIELIADIGNALIDALIMRDPGGYRDIVMILLDEKVITSEIANSLLDVVSLRPLLIQQYGDEGRDQILKAASCWPTVLQFVQAIKEYVAVT